MKLVALTGERQEEITVRRENAGYAIDLGERSYQVDAFQVHNDRQGWILSIRIDGRHFEVAVAPDGDGRYRIASGAVSETVDVLDPLTHLAREARGGAGRLGAEMMTAYMPGRVVDVLVEEGAEVEAGRGVVVLEAMKMENEIQAGCAGTVRKIFVEPGQAVEGGDPLFEIE